MIGDVAQSRWTLRFRDRGLERAYRDDLALRLRGQVTFLLGVFTVVFLASGAFDREIAGSHANGDLMLICRYAFAPIFVAAFALHARLPRAAYLRWRTTIVGSTVVAGSALLIVVSFAIPDPASFPIAASVEAGLLGMFAFALLYGVPFWLVAVSVPIGTAGFAAAMHRFPGRTDSDVSNTISGAIVVVLGAYVLEKARQQSFLANTRADRLLENVLPASIAERLKHGERRIAEQFDATTVLFADLVGFTELAASMPPARLVETLDGVFSAFDELAKRHRVEKIKTIGDAYMVVAGVPTPRGDHARAIAAMALEMRAAVAGRGDGLQLRIGIHTGPVVAGVIGSQKFIYDLWGDTVNLASRMESHGVPGAIQVSAATAAALGDAFVLESRGPIAIKGKGDQEAFLLISATVPA